MKTRTDLLNHLIQKHGLKRYLEIGLQNAAQNFDKIQCEYKVSVDPDPEAHATFCMTSDEFFEKRITLKTMSIAPSKEIAIHVLGDFDIIFIDGLHTAEQVKKDFENALQILSPNGFIVLHDCNPEKEEYTHVPRDKKGSWNGDVYKFAIELSATAAYCTVDIDNGCGVFGGTRNRDIFLVTNECEWEYFDQNRKELLNIISWDEFVKP